MVEVEKIITKEVPKIVEVPVDRIVVQVRCALLERAKRGDEGGSLSGPQLKNVRTACGTSDMCGGRHAWAVSGLISDGVCGTSSAARARTSCCTGNICHILYMLQCQTLMRGCLRRIKSSRYQRRSSPK